MKELTIYSAYSSNALASINKIIKAKGLFESLDDYYKYIINYIMHYDVDKSHGFKIKNAGYPFSSGDETKDTKLLILNQPADDFRFDNKTKSKTYIEVSDRTYALLDSLNYGSYWNIDRICDFVLYQLLHSNHKYIKVPIDYLTKQSISTTLMNYKFEDFVDDKKKHPMKYVIATQPKQRQVGQKIIKTCKFIKRTEDGYVETSIDDFINNLTQCTFTWDEAEKIPEGQISAKRSEWLYTAASRFENVTKDTIDQLLPDQSNINK